MKMIDILNKLRAAEELLKSPAPDVLARVKESLEEIGGILDGVLRADEPEAKPKKGKAPKKEAGPDVDALLNVQEMSDIGKDARAMSLKPANLIHAQRRTAEPKLPPAVEKALWTLLDYAVTQAIVLAQPKEETSGTP